MIFSFLISLLGLGGILMAAFGSYSLVNCRKSPLTIWTIMAGLYLLVIAVSSAIFRARITSMTINFLNACFLLLNIWFWLGLWVSGSYLVAQAIESGRIEIKNNQCDDGLIGVSTFLIILVWIIFFGLCLKKVATLLTKKPVKPKEEDRCHQEVSDHLFP